MCGENENPPPRSHNCKTRTPAGYAIASAGQAQWGLYIRLAQRHRVCHCHGLVRWKAHSQGSTAVPLVAVAHAMRKSLTVLKIDPSKRP